MLAFINVTDEGIRDSDASESTSVSEQCVAGQSARVDSVAWRVGTWVGCNKWAGLNRLTSGCRSFGGFVVVRLCRWRNEFVKGRGVMIF